MLFNIYSTISNVIASDKNLQTDITNTKKTLLIIDNIKLDDTSISEPSNRTKIVKKIYEDIFHIQHMQDLARTEIFNELKETVDKINDDVKQTRCHLQEITKAVKNYQNSPEVKYKRLVQSSNRSISTNSSEDGGVIKYIELEPDIDREINQISKDIEHIEELFNNVEIDINNSQNKIFFIRK